MANKIDQNPNQFLTQPNQFSPDPNQFSQIANLHANQFSQIANRHPNQFLVIQTYIPFRANSLQTDAEPGPKFETPASQRLYSVTGITVYCIAVDLTISKGQFTGSTPPKVRHPSSSAGPWDPSRAPHHTHRSNPSTCQRRAHKTLVMRTGKHG